LSKKIGGITLTTMRTLLSGNITVHIEGFDEVDVVINDGSIQVFVLISHVYASIMDVIKPLSYFLNNVEILDYREDPQYLKVRLNS
jgi:hypothetical protein